ncbi:MAG: NTP transferase domain-containing protein [Blastomonas sp.]
MDREYTVILLAAQRAGVVNPLAEKHGVSHKCLIPIDGTSLIERMLDILTAHPGCREIRILIEPEGMENVRPALARYVGSGTDIRFMESARNIAESVLIGCQGVERPCLITTADNVLLSHSSISRMIGMMYEGDDAALMLARDSDVRAVHPEAQRHFYRFRNGGFANCNLYAFAGPQAFGSTAMFREGGQFMNHPWRLVRAFGLFNILILWAGLLTVDQAMKRISRQFGITAKAAIADSGTQAIDVDNDRTYAIVEGVLTGKYR